MKTSDLIWLVVAGFVAADCVLLPALGMTITGWFYPLLGVIFLWAVSSIYRRRFPPFACIAGAGAQVAVFSHAAGLLTYGAMAASPFAMADGRLRQADAALGFDWLGWFTFVNAHPLFHFILMLAYASIPVQGFGLVIYSAFCDTRRVHELLLAAMLSVAIITPIMVFLPAVGAWSEHGVGLTEPWRGDILALRSHALTTVGDTAGIISFPSFHTVLGVLFATSARGRKWFLPVLLVNLLLIASVPTEGAHYGVDVISGFAVAFIALGATQYLLAWRPDDRRRPSPLAGISASDYSRLMSQADAVPVADRKDSTEL